MKLSIIIVNFNTKGYLKQTLQSIKVSHDKFEKEVIVVDNASTDGSVTLATIKNEHNLGYAAANNQGIRKARGEYILLLNSDTKLFSDTLQTMVQYMDYHPQVGVSTCAVELENGNLDPASHRGFPTPWSSFAYLSGLEKMFPKSRLFGQYHQGWQDIDQPHEIDTPAGAFYLTRKKVVDQVGLLDERYFMYAEDIDWSLRIKRAGWKIMYIPYTKIIHFKKQSGRASSSAQLRQKTSAHFFDTMKLFYDKHYSHKYPWIIRWLTLSGIWLVSQFRN